MIGAFRYFVTDFKPPWKSSQSVYLCKRMCVFICTAKHKMDLMENIQLVVLCCHLTNSNGIFMLSLFSSRGLCMRDLCSFDHFLCVWMSVCLPVCTVRLTGYFHFSCSRRLNSNEMEQQRRRNETRFYVILLKMIHRYNESYLACRKKL